MIDTMKRPQGLATLSLERRREIAAQGGRKSHALGTAHEWTAEEARAAGKKGMAKRWAKREEQSV